MSNQNQKQYCITQSGFVLLTALIFLVITTMLGVTMLRMNTMDERMVGNVIERNKCLEAAEAALKHGENRVHYMDPNLSPGSDTGAGPSRIYSRESPVIENLRAKDLQWWHDNAVEFDTDIAGVDDPHFIIQFFDEKLDGGGLEAATTGSGTEYYRVTARCQDRGDQFGTAVILQSVFTRRK